VICGAEIAHTYVGATMIRIVKRMGEVFFTRRRIRILAIAFIAAMTAAYLVLRLTAVHEIDRNGNALFPDFAQIYIAGRHILHGEGQSLYDRELFYREVNSVLHETDSAGFYPVYPPITAVFAAPWAMLSYPAAAWMHAILAALVACWLARDMARYFFGRSEDASMAILLFLAFLPWWRTWMFGQFSIWALAILWGSWRLWRSNVGFASGCVLALGLLKPQLFIGAWIWAVLWGNGRLRAGLALGLVAGVALGIIFGGGDIWAQWVQAIANTAGFRERVHWMTSLPHAWRLAGGEGLLGGVWSYVVMFVGAVVWGIALLRLKCNDSAANFMLPAGLAQANAGLGGANMRQYAVARDNPSSNAPAITALCLALVGGWILSPRMYVYDWILAWPLFLAAWKYGSPRMRQVIAWCAPLFWIHDFFAMLHIPILTLLGIAAFLLLLHQAFVQSVDGKMQMREGWQAFTAR
jgi:hypothetical protein